MTRSPVKVTEKESYRHCRQCSRSRRRGRREEEDDSSCTAPPSSTPYSSSRQTRRRERSPHPKKRDRSKSCSNSSSEYHRNRHRRGESREGRGGLEDDTKHRRGSCENTHSDHQNRQRDREGCTQGSISLHHASSPSLNSSFALPQVPKVAPLPSSVGVTHVARPAASAPLSAAEAPRSYRLPEEPLVSPKPTKVHVKKFDERRQLLRTGSSSTPSGMQAPEVADERSVAIVVNTGATDVLPADGAQESTFLKAPPSPPPQFVRLRPATPAVVPAAGLPSPPPLGISNITPLSEEEYLTWLHAPSSSTETRTRASVPPEAGVAARRFARRERVPPSYSVKEHHHEQARDTVSLAVNQFHHSSSATIERRESATTLPVQGSEVVSTAVGPSPGTPLAVQPSEISYNRSFSVLTSWDALMVAPPLLRATPRTQSLFAHHVGVLGAAAVPVGGRTSPAHTCMCNDGPCTSLMGPVEELETGTARPPGSPKDTGAVSQCPCEKIWCRAEEVSTRTFEKHFVNGLVFVEPPWFICPSLLDNCEHPYYLTWLDALEVGSVAEAVAEAKTKLRTDA